MLVEHSAAAVGLKKRRRVHGNDERAVFAKGLLYQPRPEPSVVLV